MKQKMDFPMLTDVMSKTTDANDFSDIYRSSMCGLGHDFRVNDSIQSPEAVPRVGLQTILNMATSTTWPREDV